MFGWRKKQQPDGMVCPLCQTTNVQEAESCTCCHYDFTVAAHRQVVSEVTEDEKNDLFAELMGDEEIADADNALVDWSAHSFTMDDMTVEVSQYDDDGLVEVDQSISMEHQFEAPQSLAKVKSDSKESEDEDYVLTSADAPKNVTKFDAGDGPDLAFEEEEYAAPVVQLVEMTESEDIEPVQSASTIEGLDDLGESSESVATPVPEPVSEPEPQPTTAPVPIPNIPQIPSVAAVNGATTTPVIPAPSPVTESTVVEETPTPPSVGLWPWPQADAWDDSTLRKALKETMELAKSGNLDEAKRGLVSIGPHLGDRIDLVFHIGVLLKRFGQEDVMRRMIETAQRDYPEIPQVSKAVEHLLA
ncbi:MAG: hypothetical protein VX627_04380 [Candidatus Thermoplasmatota archaeon]|nr:hypothetical protein [Candidatus Thermoplasmatota archaeon]